MEAARPLDALNAARNKRVIVELKNGRQYIGALRAFDIHINVVLEDAEERHNGEILRKPVGNAYFEYQGTLRAAPVVFGDKGIFLLGATTLEALGMILDPIHRQLKPLPMLLMPFRRAS